MGKPQSHIRGSLRLVAGASIHRPQTKQTQSQSYSTSEIKGPTNPEAEQLLIGNLLNANDLYYEVSGKLKPEHFADNTSGELYRIIGQIVKEGREATPVTISAMMGPGSNLDGYLRALAVAAKEASDNGVTHTVSGLASEIIDLARRRKLIGVAEEIGASAQLRGVISTNDLHQKVVESILNTLPSGSDSPTQSVGELAKETLAEIRHIRETGIRPGFRSGFLSFDELVGPMLPGDLIVVGGATSAGKTALVQQVAFFVAHQRQVLVMSLEMTKRQWNNRYITQLTRIPAERLELGEITDAEERLILQAGEGTLQHLKMDICDRTGLTVPEIEAEARLRRKLNGALDLLVIDHLQFIQPPEGKEGPAAIADVTRGLKAMAKALEVPILLVSHLNREPSKRTNSHRPLLSDLYGGGAIEKDADTVMFVHREAYWLAREGPKSEEDRLEWELKLKEIENEAELILAKRRRGKGADYRKVVFEPELTLFRDPD